VSYQIQEKLGLQIMFGYWLLYEIGAELRRLRLTAGSSANKVLGKSDSDNGT
jgi:hypothetical protein